MSAMMATPATSPVMEKPTSVHRALLPEGWKRPSGYSNGMAASGRTVFVSGQVGWDVEGRFAPTLAEQVRQTLSNIVAVLGEGGAGPEHLTRLTWYVVDMDAYTGALREIGAA